jgi:LmbE family N-acetylglucosaminyl deacetylase
MIFTHDPNWYYRINDEGTAWVNHSDHRACGIAVLDAVYPLSRDLQSFPEHVAEGLHPHITPELYLFNFDSPGHLIDISEHIDAKLASIAAHQSQIDDPESQGEWLKRLHAKLGQPAGLPYAESFVRLEFELS